MLPAAPKPQSPRVALKLYGIDEVVCVAVWGIVVLLAAWTGCAGLHRARHCDGRGLNRMLALSIWAGLMAGAASMAPNGPIPRSWVLVTIAVELPAAAGIIVYARRGLLSQQVRLLTAATTVYGRDVLPDARVDPGNFSHEEFPVACPHCEYLLKTATNRCSECGRELDRGRLIVEQYAIEGGRRFRGERFARLRRRILALMVLMYFPVIAWVAFHLVLAPHQNSPIILWFIHRTDGLTWLFSGTTLLALALLAVLIGLDRRARRATQSKAMRVLDEIAHRPAS